MLTMTNWPNKTRQNPTSKIQYAYKASEEDPLILVPDMDVVPLVEEAMDYLDNGYSSRQVAQWLSEKSGHDISHQGILIIWRRHRTADSDRIKKLNKDNRKRKPKTYQEKELARVKRKAKTAWSGIPTPCTTPHMAGAWLCAYLLTVTS